MKRFFILVFVLVCNYYHVNAQIYVSCTHRDYYTYSEYDEDFKYDSGYDENSMFEINKEQTMFKHTTPTISSAYYVSSSHYDENDEILYLEVVSDVGNNYLYMFDAKNNLVKVLYEVDNETKLIVFTIKKIWTKE